MFFASACPAFFFFQNSLTGKLDLVAFLADAFDDDLLAFLQLVADVADAAVGDLGDMQQAVRAREDLDKSTEIDDTRNRTHDRFRRSRPRRSAP